MSEFQAGTTVVLQASYFDASDDPINADSEPVVEIRDARNRIVQTNIISIRTSAGVYQAKLATTGLQKGTYFHVWSADFDGYPDKKSGQFTLRDIVV